MLVISKLFKSSFTKVVEVEVRTEDIPLKELKLKLAEMTLPRKFAIVYYYY